MRTLCKRYRVHYCDLLGHPIDAVARVSGLAAKMEPGAQPVLDSAYFKRIAAIEFAVKLRRRRRAHGLQEADIVLVGVSRTLEDAALDVPRLPRLQDRERPDRPRDRAAAGALRDRPARRSSASRSTRSALARSAPARARRCAARTRYAELVEIYEELEHAEAVHRRLGCPVLDVSKLAIEETAHRSSGSSSSASSRRRPHRRDDQEPPIPRWLLAALDARSRRGAGRLLRDPDAGLDGIRGIAWLSEHPLFRARR